MLVLIHNHLIRLNCMESNQWVAIILALLGINSYFIKRLITTLDRVAEDVADMKPKVNILWEKSLKNS